MKPCIDLIAPPFSGHLHPLLGIGRRLAEEYAVRVISSAGAVAQIEAAGLHAVGLLPGREPEIRAIVEPPYAIRNYPWRLHEKVRANIALLGDFRAELQSLYAKRPPALAIVDFTLPAAGAVARDFGVPWWTSLPSPCVVETPDGPPPYLGGLRPRSGLLGRLRDTAGRMLIRGFKLGIHRLYRRQIGAFGFESLYRNDGSEALYSSERILALGLAQLEFPRRWPPAWQWTGPVLYTPPCPAPAPSFAAGRRHVLATLGTHLRWRKDAVAEALRAAARARPDIEFHFSDGEYGSRRRESDGNFHRFGFVPYARDLPRYDLVLHHGGAGVMYHCLAAARPALVLPTDYDQFDHAARLEAAGAALRVRRLSELPALIAAALDNEAMHAACRRFADLLPPGEPEERIADEVRAWLRKAPEHCRDRDIRGAVFDSRTA